MTKRPTWMSGMDALKFVMQRTGANKETARQMLREKVAQGKLRTQWADPAKRGH